MKKILIALLMLCGFTAQSQVTKVDENLYLYSQNPGNQHNCGLDVTFNPEIHENLASPIEGSTVSYIWPFDEELDEGVLIVNYVDDLSGGSIKDYNDNDWSYNGHNGTDIALHDFRQMDRCVRVKAAAAGTVVQVSLNNFDRNVEWGTGLPANLVQIRHIDGTYAFYYHLMKRSVTVKLGEYVLQGQTIGYVGSSGNSTDAHLHFEPGYYSGNTWVKRDPWQGTYNHSASLWENQNPYVGFRDFKLHDCGVFTESLVGGNFDNTGNYMKERIYQPNTISGYEPEIGFWMRFQGNYTGKQVRFQMRKSDGSLFKETYFYISDQSQYNWSLWTPDFNPGVSVTGDWYVRILYDNVEQFRSFFNVQLLTSNRPRLYPVAAKCFRRSIFVQRDTLRVRPVRANMQYDLLNAPSEVSIVNDSIITIGAFTQTYRTREFKVIASIGGNSALRDTMVYKLIDTTKNPFPGNGIESLELTAKLEGFWDGSEMNEDTVTVFVRAPLSPYNLVDSAKILLDKKGYALANFFNTTSGIYYYLVVKHRNSIETWSKTAQQLTANDPVAYDFTTSRTKAYGDNLKYKNGDYCIYGGDVNQDRIVDLTDSQLIDNDANDFVWGYVKTDLTGDNFVDINDAAIADNNSFNYVSVIRP